MIAGCSAARVHRIPLRVRDDRERPFGDGTAIDILLIWVKREAQTFLQMGLDRKTARRRANQQATHSRNVRSMERRLTIRRRLSPDYRSHSEAQRSRSAWSGAPRR